MSVLRWMKTPVLLTVALVSVSCFNSSNVKIGVIIPIEGDLGDYGYQIHSGIQMAHEEIMADASLKKNYELIIRNEDSDPEKVLETFKELKSKGVTAVIGAATSAATIALTKPANEAEIILMSPAASSPEINTGQGDFIFRNYPSDTLEAQQLSNVIFQKCRIQKVLMVMEKNAFSEGITHQLLRFGRQNSTQIPDHVVKFDASGEIASNNAAPADSTADARATDPAADASSTDPTAEANTTDTADAGSTDAAAGSSDSPAYAVQAVNGIIDVAPQAVFLAAYNDSLVTVLREIRSRPELNDTYIFTCSSLLLDKAREQLGEEANTLLEGVIFTAYPWEPTAHPEFSQKFSENYQADPTIYAATGYDALKILVAAIDNTQHAIADDLKSELSKETYSGILGETDFNKRGDVTRIPIVYRITNGVPLPLSPEDMEKIKQDVLTRI